MAVPGRCCLLGFAAHSLRLTASRAGPRSVSGRERYAKASHRETETWKTGSSGTANILGLPSIPAGALPDASPALFSGIGRFHQGAGIMIRFPRRVFAAMALGSLVVGAMVFQAGAQR